jgi:hypothetical protein
MTRNRGQGLKDCAWILRAGQQAAHQYRVSTGSGSTIDVVT